MIRYKTQPRRKQFQVTNYFSSQDLREMIGPHGAKKMTAGVAMNETQKIQAEVKSP